MVSVCIQRKREKEAPWIASELDSLQCMYTEKERERGTMEVVTSSVNGHRFSHQNKLLDLQLVHLAIILYMIKQISFKMSREGR